MHASLSSSLGHSNRLFSHSNRTKNRDKKSLNFIFRFNWIIRNSCVLHASGLSQSADTLGHQWNQINKCIAFFCSYPSNEWCAIRSTINVGCVQMEDNVLANKMLSNWYRIYWNLIEIGWAMPDRRGQKAFAWKLGLWNGLNWRIRNWMGSPAFNMPNRLLIPTKETSILD